MASLTKHLLLLSIELGDIFSEWVTVVIKDPKTNGVLLLDTARTHQGRCFDEIAGALLQGVRPEHAALCGVVGPAGKVFQGDPRDTGTAWFYIGVLARRWRHSELCGRRRREPTGFSREVVIDFNAPPIRARSDDVFDGGKAHASVGRAGRLCGIVFRAVVSCSLGARSKRLCFIFAGCRIGEAAHPGPKFLETIVLEGAAGAGQTFKQGAADLDTLTKILKNRPKSEGGKLLHAYCKAKAARLEIKNLTKEEPREKGTKIRAD